MDAAFEAQKRDNERLSARIAKDAAIAAEREREVAALEEDLVSARRGKVRTLPDCNYHTFPFRTPLRGKVRTLPQPGWLTTTLQKCADQF